MRSEGEGVLRRREGEGSGEAVCGECVVRRMEEEGSARISKR